MFPTKVRKKYVLKKRHARVRFLSVIAGKKNPVNSTTAIARLEVPPCDVAAGGIEVQLSPPKKRRAKKARSCGSGATSGE